MDAREVADRAEAYLRTHFGSAPAMSASDQPSICSRADTSTRSGLVYLLQFIQEEFGVEIPDKDLLSDDSGMIEGVARIVCGGAVSST